MLRPIFQPCRRRRLGAVLAVLGAGPGFGAGAAELQPVAVVEVTPPLCSRFPHNNQLACTNVVQVVVRIPDDGVNPGLVRCVLHSAEQQVLGSGEAILRPPTGRLWVVLRSRHRFGSTVLPARTDCTIQPPLALRDQADPTRRREPSVPGTPDG